MRDIQMALELWGAWSKQRYGTEYPSIAAGFSSLLPQGPSPLSCSDDEGLIIDSCIAKLKKKKPDEYDLILNYYVRGVSKRNLAKNLGCDEKLIRVKLKMAEGFIEGCLAMLNNNSK
jgi:hypothetical protein